MSRAMFEGVMQKYENVKKSLKEKLEAFKNKFEGKKSEMSQEVLKLQTPEDMIAFGKRIQEEGEAMQAEQEGIKQEESLENSTYEERRQEEVNKAHEQALEGSEHYEEAEAMNDAFDKKKAEEERLAAEEAAAHEAYVRKEADESGARIAELRAALNGEAPAAQESVEPTVVENTGEEFEDEYGMSMEAARNLLASQGYPKEQIQASDPQFREKIEEFHDNQKAFGRVRVKLFDKVLSGKASEAEIKMAEEHAASAASGWSLEAFNGGIPQSWYANERIANALAGTSENNKKWVEKVRKTYTPEQLKRDGFERIDERGFKAVYSYRE